MNDNKYWRMLEAALNDDKSIYGQMDEKESQLFDRMRKQINRQRKANPQVTFSIPESLDLPQF